MMGSWTQPAPGRSAAGISLTEILVVIAIIGVLAMVAIPYFSDLTRSSQTTVARNALETLNTAVHKFNMTNYELLFTGVAPSGQDEMLILRTMQYRDPANPKPGAPYVRNDWNPAISSNQTDFRLMWTGTLYKLLPPGTSGTGLKVVFDGSDLGTPFEFPPNFTMAGK